MAMALKSVRCAIAVECEGTFFMVGCVISQLKPSELYILSCENGLGLLGLYPIRNGYNIDAVSSGNHNVCLNMLNA